MLVSGLRFELRPSKCKPGEFNHMGAMLHTVVERNTAAISLSQDHEFPPEVILDMALGVIICYLELMHLKTLPNNTEVIGEVW
jgi:hypothetical protein